MSAHAGIGGTVVEIQGMPAKRDEISVMENNGAYTIGCMSGVLAGNSMVTMLPRNPISIAGATNGNTIMFTIGERIESSPML